MLVGSFFYSRLAERVFAVTDEPTPATSREDGVDYIPLPTWKVFMIQLLNIAGLGPIFGAIGGALWGPCVYFWIVLGTIFAGGVHDYLSGMISLREDGKTIAEIVGKYMGRTMHLIMRILTVVLLVLIGTVFMVGPAGLLSSLTGVAETVLLPCVLLYYFLATLLPIDTLIARFYPIFGACFLIMAFGIMGGMFLGVGGHAMMEMQLANLHPSGDAMPILPMMFITVACGAISGFHATQSPIMSRCLKKEKAGRHVFYGAMVAEGIIALIWASAGIAFYDGTGGLAAALAEGGAGSAVYDICIGFMGGDGSIGARIGVMLAMLGIIICPITSGDTAFRSARLTIADWLSWNQRSIKNRLPIAIPLLAAGGILSQMNFDIIWRYASWTNQVLAMIVLWTGAVYLCQKNPTAKYYLIAAVPAAFMSAVTFMYILQAPEGLMLPTAITYPAGIIFGAVCAVLFARYAHRMKTASD